MAKMWKLLFALASIAAGSALGKSTSSSAKITSSSTKTSTTTTVPISPSPAPTPITYTIFAGGYTSFIATYQFTPLTGKLKYISQSKSNSNVSWIEQHPTLRHALYATNENTNGGIESFLINPNGTLTSVATHSSGGSDPAHLLVFSDYVAIMNYNGGNGTIFPLDSTGLRFLTQGESKVQFAGNPSHPHESYPDQSGNGIYVPDLGANQIWHLRLNSAGIFSIVGNISQPAGSGPRHMQIFDGVLFVLHELTSTLTAQPLPIIDGIPSKITSNVSIVPPYAPAGAVWAAAELLSPDLTDEFPTPYLYASNRNTGVQDPRGDAITILQYNSATKTLHIVDYVYTGLDQIRGMQIGGQNQEYLIAGSFAGTAGVAIFERTNGGRSLKLIARESTIPTRTSFVWYSDPGVY